MVFTLDLEITIRLSTNRATTAKVLTKNRFLPTPVAEYQLQ
jgi:hypothetical protein